MIAYGVFKFIHILSVIVFLGNIYTGLYWMRLAHKTKKREIINHTMRGIILADRYFTIPGVVLITAGGIASAIHLQYPILSTGWIFWSIVLFSISGIAFGWRVAPLQRKIVLLTSQEEFDWVSYNKLYVAWDIWGAVALITPLAALVMMILKWPQSSGL